MSPHRTTVTAAIDMQGLGQVTQPLREAARAILEAHGAPAKNASACGRFFSLDKSLAWKVYHVAYASQMLSALAAMPGLRGWEIAIAEFRARTTSDALLSQLTAAIGNFEAYLAERRIDRRILAGMVAAAGVGDESTRQMLALRKTASEAAGLILGVQLHARIACYLVAPSATEGLVDSAAVTIFDGLERRRSGVPAVLYIPQQFRRDESAAFGHYGGLAAAADDFPLIADLSTPGILGNELQIEPPRPGRQREFNFLSPVPGRTERLVAVFGEIGRALGSARCTETDKTAELGLPLTLPASLVVYDICVHRSLPRGSEPIVEHFSTPDATHAQRFMRDRSVLPLDAGLELVTSSDIDGVSDATNGKYRELCARAASALGNSIDEYDRYRVALPYPTTPSALLASWTLGDPLA